MTTWVICRGTSPSSIVSSFELHYVRAAESTTNWVASMDVTLTAGFVLMMLLFPEALGDAIDWKAMLQPQGGGVRYDGDGAYVFTLFLPTFFLSMLAHELIKKQTGLHHCTESVP